MFKTIFAVLLASLCASGVRATYTLQTDYGGTNFFNGFDFFTDPDPTAGTVKFLDESAANETSLAGFIDTDNGNMAIYMGADSETNITDGSGRPSVRVSSSQTFHHGLFIVDILHMPTGCGTWPAFWMVGPNWPQGGEIDIVEGVHTQAQNAMTLHTSEGFTLSAATADFSGNLINTDCGADSGHQGCQIMDTSNLTFGADFNTNQGGVYATEWTSDSIKIWFFPRGSIPADITSATPNPTSWGTPKSLFASNGTFAIDDHFQNQQIVFDTTFCGDWAGTVWNQTECAALAPTCAEYVQKTPSAFKEAYWAVNNLQVFQDDATSSTGGTNTTAPAKLRRKRR